MLNYVLALRNYNIIVLLQRTPMDNFAKSYKTIPVFMKMELLQLKTQDSAQPFVILSPFNAEPCRSRILWDSNPVTPAVTSSNWPPSCVCNTEMKHRVFFPLDNFGLILAGFLSHRRRRRRQWQRRRRRRCCKSVDLSSNVVFNDAIRIRPSTQCSI